MWRRLCAGYIARANNDSHVRTEKAPARATAGKSGCAVGHFSSSEEFGFPVRAKFVLSLIIASDSCICFFEITYGKDREKQIVVQNERRLLLLKDIGKFDAM